MQFCRRGKYLLIIVMGLLLGGCIGTDLVEETALADPEIRIGQMAVALLNGDNLQLDARYYDGFGNHDPLAPLRWVSTDPGIASVTNDGTVSAVNPGQTSIRVSLDTLTAPPFLVTVVADANAAAVVRVTPDSLSLDAGGTATASVVARNIDGNEIVPGSVFWTSSDEAIAGVDASGLVTARAPGVAQITATVDNIASSPARVVVRGRARTGTFTKRPGTSYDVSGGVELRELQGGQLRLQFGSNFSTSDGPDIDVYLSKTNQVTGTSLSLGNVIATRGQQSYAVPGAPDLDEFSWVIIHCVAFNVTFGYARLQ